VIGIMEDLPFEIGEVELKPGDLLFAYTDGFTDARNEKGEFFSEERMLSQVLKYADQPESVAGRLMEDVKAFIGTADQFDDLTALGLHRRKPASAETGG
jgi:sigma-B regulation protein RsbU (phosphoserine phosphatase)